MATMAIDIRLKGRQSTRDRLFSDITDDHDVTSEREGDLSSRQYGKYDQAKDENYKIEIVRKLIENFDLETTLDRYRNMDTREYQLRPGTFSINGQGHARRVRTRISDLMGSDVIQLNNSRYAERLTEKIQARRKAEIAAQEKELQDLEYRRLRRLLAEGIITAHDFHEQVNFNDRSKDASNGRRKTSPRSKSKCKSAMMHRKKTYPSAAWRRSKSAPIPYASHRGKSQASDYGWRPRPSYKAPKKTAAGELDCYSVSSFSVESQMSRNEARAREQRLANESKSDAMLEWDRARSSRMSNYGRYHTKRVIPPKERDPLIDELWKEETISGMYRVAEEILPPDRPKPDAAYRIKRELPKAKPKAIQLNYSR